MENVESVAIVPFFIPDIGVAYFVGHFNPEDIVLDETGDDSVLMFNENKIQTINVDNMRRLI